MINYHKASMELEVQSRDETQFGEWKIQLEIQIKLICSKYSGEIIIWNT